VREIVLEPFLTIVTMLTCGRTAVGSPVASARFPPIKMPLRGLAG